MKLSGTFVFMLCALTGGVGAAEVNVTNNSRQNALSMDTWYRVGVTRTTQNAVKNVTAMADTAPATKKLVFNLRRH